MLSSSLMCFVPEACSKAWLRARSCKMMKENARRMHGSARKNCKILHQSTILHLILHPILHPKSLVNTTGFVDGCRKCRRFSETFFVGGREARSGSCKTSDFFDRKYGCFASKVRMFASKKSDVFVFRQGGKHGIRILLI